MSTGFVRGEPPGMPIRHPLGLPAGSVRALLTLMVLGLIWTLLVLEKIRPEGQIDPPPIYLYYLMFLILGHFFAAHGHSIAGAGSLQASPWHLPRGMIRALLVLGFVGVFAWRFYTDRDWRSLVELKQSLPEQPYLPFVLLAAFFLGILFGRIVHFLQRRPGGFPYWFQDVLAWISLLAMLGLAAEVIVLVVINPGLPEDRRIHWPTWQAWLGAVISFYFGLRS